MATIDQRYTTVLGPIKLEVLKLSSVTKGDSFVSNLQDPKYIMAMTPDVGLSAEHLTSLSRTGLSGREITLTNSNFPANSDVVALVLGY